MNDCNFLLFCTVHVYFLAEPLSSLNSPERCDEQPLNVRHWDPGVGKCSVCWTFIKDVSHWTLTIMLTLGHTCKFKPPPCYKGGGGWGGDGGWWVEFLICCIISKRFYLQWKTFNLLYKMMRYILWLAALLGACDVINNGCYLGRHLGIYQELVIMLKPREMVIFCAWHKK